MRDEVQAVADTEHRQAQRKHAVVGGRSIVIVNRRRASAQDDAGRPIALDLIQWSGTGQDNGKYFEFADAARNKLGVLRTEVENDDGLFFHEQFSLIRDRV
jgi:hypothetical protein